MAVAGNGGNTCAVLRHSYIPVPPEVLRQKLEQRLDEKAQHGAERWQGKRSPWMKFIGGTGDFQTKQLTNPRGNRLSQKLRKRMKKGVVTWLFLAATRCPLLEGGGGVARGVPLVHELKHIIICIRATAFLWWISAWVFDISWSMDTVYILMRDWHRCKEILGDLKPYNQYAKSRCLHTNMLLSPRVVQV